MSSAVCGIALLMVLLTGFTGPAFAQGIVPDYQCAGVSVKETGKYGLGGFLDLGQNILKFVLGISGAFALLMFVWGGFLMLSSGGADARVTQGREALLQATTGIIIILGSWVFVNLIVIALSGGTISNTAASILGKPWSQYDQDCSK